MTSSSERRDVRRDLAPQALAAAIGAIAVGIVGWLHSIGATSLLMWWVSGVLAGLLMRLGPRLSGGMWIGALVANLALGATPLAALLLSGGLVGGPAALAFYLRRSDFVASFPRRAELLRFALASAVAMTVPPALTWLGMHALKVMPGPPVAGRYVAQWWAHGTVAVLLIAPAVAGVSRATLAGWRRAPLPLLEALLALALLVAANAALPADVLRVTTMPLALLLAVYVAQRSDMVFGSLYCLGVVMSIILRTAPGGNGFFYALMVAATTLLVRAMFTERRLMQQRLHADEAHYRDELLRAASLERRRIGRDVHDTIGQELTAIALLARLVESRAQRQAPALAAEAAAVQQACGRAVRSTRAISHRLLSGGAPEARP